MMSLMKRLWHDEQGQDLAEYGIALAVIAAGVALIVSQFGDAVSDLWTQGQQVVEQAASQGG